MRNQTALLTIFMGLLFLHCSAPSEQTLAIKNAVTGELHRYPQATLLDLYKFFFQGAFGPGHLIPNPEMARQYLEEELRTSTRFDTVRWQPVGYQDNFYRINLSVLHEDSVSAQTLLAAFVESANEASPPTLDEWRKEWQKILGVIEAMQLNLPDFERDKESIGQQLAEGKTIGHHSAKFEELYQPHYRVVDKKHFAALLRQ